MRLPTVSVLTAALAMAWPGLAPSATEPASSATIPTKVVETQAAMHGEAASEKLFGLLAGHWGAICAYLDAMHAGKKADQEAAFKELVDNAGEISTFLGGANPHLPVETLRGLPTTHGAHHVEQIKQLAAGQYAQEAATWTAMTRHMYVIADALVGGIAKQFPDKFR
jgi:hypothetical protein